jgi:hypothetical protein
VEQQSLERRVLDELLVLRKTRAGLTVESLAHADTITQLLGAGDPYVAFTRIRHEVLGSDLDITVRAAAASLGLSSDGDTHLKRLDDFGVEAHLDQRQVRRHSDKGIQTLARLISTNWPTETVPELTVIVACEKDRWEIHFSMSRPLVVEMRQPIIEILLDTESRDAEISLHTQTLGDREHSAGKEPVIVSRAGGQTSLVIVWRGELWPKFTVIWRNAPAHISAEALGNKLMLRLSGE